ncbi:hypothetical protein FQN54_009605 [Arachnomyces sp. PD_36]|nr:hypothetical protein FQN54_009605 [Arachnomyces sp. PD_36]
MSLPNIWHHRKVADSSAKACYICYKPSTSVLITPDNRDFFYTCPSHLKEKGFCSPIIDAEAEAAKKKKEEMDKEIEAVKKEFEEKQKKKKGKKKDKKDEDEGKKGKSEEDEGKKEEKERDDKIAAIQKAGGESGSKAGDDDSPRVYSLHKNFYQMRIDRLRNIEIAKRNRERLRDPTSFPTAPKGDI